MYLALWKVEIVSACAIPGAITFLPPEYPAMKWGSTKPDTIHYHDVQCPKCKPTYDYYKEQNDSVYYFHQNINEPNQQDSGTKNKLEKHFEIVFDEIKNQLIN